MRQFPLLLLLAACSADTAKTVEATDSSDEGSADGSGAADTGADATADAVADADDATEGSGSGEPVLTEEERLRALLDPAPCVVVEPLSWSPLPSMEAFAGERRYSPLSAISIASAVPFLFATPEHTALLADRRARRATALESCGGDIDCLRTGLSWSVEESDRLAAIVAPAQEAVASLRNEALETGYPFGLAVPPEESFLAELVSLQVFLQNQAISRAVGEADPAAIAPALAEVAGSAATVDADSGLVTAALLRAAGRDEAFRYGPDASFENQAAIDAIASIDFAAYPYTAILVPGQGPTDDTTALNPAGINRINTAVARWRAGLAPLLLVSGGHVHPDKTPFCEAIEMRRYLIDELGIPASAIVVDPYARHTTTNLRNAARILKGVGVPMDRPILVTSDLLQLAGIVFGLAPRCEEELGFVPWQSLARLNTTDACAVLTPDSQRLDRGDSLDP